MGTASWVFVAACEFRIDARATPESPSAERPPVRVIRRAISSNWSVASRVLPSMVILLPPVRRRFSHGGIHGMTLTPTPRAAFFTARGRALGRLFVMTASV